MRILLLIVLILIIIPLGVLLLFSSTPTLQVQPQVAYIGAATPLQVRVSEPHGLRRLAAYVEQNGARYTVYEANRPATRLSFFGKHEPDRVVTITPGTRTAPSLKDGRAHLVIEAQANDFRGSTSREGRDVIVVTRVPYVNADGAQHYVNQGGSELVTFTVDGIWTKAGVKAGPYTFGSFEAGGKSKNDRLALFAFPWDLPVSAPLYAYASNPAGNEAQGRFSYKIFPKKFRHRDLELSDAFLEKVDNEIEPNGSGDLVTRFLHINRDLRKQNNQTLADLRTKTEPRFLWTGAFLPLSDSTVESQFADVRSYYYKGKKIDQQVHLGFDLAKVKNTPIPASNDGKVVWAQRLGIYGNCVVIDHGYGLQSIYGHLSRIDVKPGQMVKRGEIIGLSGATGLAGGDHLHYSMQVDGVEVNPIEWWDAHWIQDRILSKISPRQS